jgi:ferritin-like metal-binding protein YciE
VGATPVATLAFVARSILRKERPMPRLASMDDLLVHEMQDIYHAENQILKALPKLAKAATHPDLKRAFEEHRRETEGQVRRLEQSFKLLGVPARGRKCEGMVGLLKVEHYEIASYGCICTYAEMLGYDQVHELLGQNLDEEESTDQKLTALAENVINQEAEDVADAEA